MGRAENNFKKRFGDPLRIIVKFAEKPCDSAPRDFNNKRIAKALAAVMSSIVGREVTPAELLGPVGGRLKCLKLLGKPRLIGNRWRLDYQI